ncbi:MAG: alpha/beta hydrolase [Novosphingobium sp.]|nr:alpha/beta hydrolase [Novosphingobium sp.]
MRILAAILLPILACMAPATAAHEITYQEVIVEETVIEEVVWIDAGSERFVGARDETAPQGLASYGPFRVLDDSRAALVDVTDARSPAAFAAMLRDYPAIGMIEMIDCPGTEDDEANLRLGRMIRESGIATYVPPGGSVRSGAVELFLAGAHRMAAPQAEFAVHAWMDDLGREATDYAASDPANRKYLAYYRAMGMSAQEAADFYAMTNSAPHASALWLTGRDMAQWVRLDEAA